MTQDSQTTYPQRPCQALNPEGPKPDCKATDVVVLAQQLTQSA